MPTALAFAQADLDDSIGQAFTEVAPPEMRRSGPPTFGRLSSRSWHPWTGPTFIVCTASSRIISLFWLPRGMSIIAYCHLFDILKTMKIIRYTNITMHTRHTLLISLDLGRGCAVPGSQHTLLRRSFSCRYPTRSRKTDIRCKSQIRHLT